MYQISIKITGNQLLQGITFWLLRAKIGEIFVFLYNSFLVSCICSLQLPKTTDTTMVFDIFLGVFIDTFGQMRHLSSALVTTVNMFCLHFQDKQDMKNGEEPDNEGWVTIPVKKKNLKKPAKTKKQILKEEKKKRKENVSDI